MKEYKVIPLDTSLFMGHLDAAKLQRALNSEASLGWHFVRSIKEERRSWFGGREAHFLVFEREIGVAEQSALTSYPAEVEAGSLGVQMNGRAVQHVIPDGPAARAGIQPGDRIFGIDGQKFGDDRASNALLTGAPGTVAELLIVRNGNQLRLVVERAT